MLKLASKTLLLCSLLGIQLFVFISKPVMFQNATVASIAVASITPHQTHYWALACFIAIIAIKLEANHCDIFIQGPERSVCRHFHSFIQTKKAFNIEKHSRNTEAERTNFSRTHIHRVSEWVSERELLWKG